MNKRGTPENLVPFTFRSKEEVRKINRKGGIASGITRRKKKDKAAAIAALLQSAPITKQDADLMDKALLLMSEEELKKVAANKELPQDVRTKAALLSSEDMQLRIETADRMRDRVFGKPRQAVDLAVDDTPPASVIEVATTID